MKEGIQQRREEERKRGRRRSSRHRKKEGEKEVKAIASWRTKRTRASQVWPEFP